MTEARYQSNRVTLYLGDCLEVLPTLAAGSVDAVITDPPYGVDFRGESWDRAIPDWLPSARIVAPLVAFTTGVTTLWKYPQPDWVCCWYREASNSRSKLGGFSHWTPILVYGKGQWPVDCIKMHAIEVAYPRGFPHPSPKPERLMRWMVQNAVPEGAIIFDPFMGSGTTGVACVQLGRRFIGCEIDPVYYAIAERRIRDAESQLLLPM